MEPKVSIIILNWNGWKDTIECLESIYQIDYLNYDVIVIDNNSENDSIEKISKYCSGELKIESKFFQYKLDNKPIQIFEYLKDEIKGSKIIDEFKEASSNKKLMLIKNDKNYGFAEGNNIAIRFTLKNLNPQYVLLLNNDTVVDKYFLNELINVADRNNEIGVVGPKTYYYDYNGRTNVTNFEGGKINFLKGEVAHISNKKNITQPQNVDYVEGSCFLIRNVVINEVGLLDKDYFLYWEETDWCTRITKAEYKLVYVPKAEIWHKFTESVNSTNIYFMTRNRFLFMKKNFNKMQMLSSLIYYFFFKFWFKLFAYTFYHKKPKMVSHFLKGTKDGLKILIS
ncbi:MAG: glycosyltransferase family 2 protein [Methanobacterium paludis]|nr:glycosyltransferase family 2 protein [Methanobacterium paludis]